jgi:hypothetical protein
MNRAKHILLLVGFILAHFLTIAGKLDKGMEALQSYNFATAKQLFEKALKKETAGASYGLSILYGVDNNPFFQLDSAYKYITQADSLFPKLDEKQQEVLAEITITDSAIQAQKLNISSQFYALIASSNVQADFDSFLVWHPWAIELEQATTIRNELAFQTAIRSNTYQAFALFMEMYPEADEVPLAQKKYDELFFRTKTKANSVEAYQQFIQDHPNSPYKKHAETMVYQLTVSVKNEERLNQFIKENPQNHLINEAWKELYEYRIQTFAPEEVTEFLLDYAEYPFRDEAMRDVERSKQWYIPAKSGSQWGYVDSTGSWLIPALYEWAEPFNEGKALVFQDGLAGFINKRGEQIISCVYEDAFSFEESRAIVESDAGFGVISYLGDTVIDPTYADLGLFSDGMVYAAVEDKYGYFNREGSLVVPFLYDLAFDFQYGHAIVKRNGKYGVINQSGEVVVPENFDKILFATDSLVVVETGNLYGLLSLARDTVIPVDKDYIGLFHDNRSLVIQDDDYGYINSRGDTVIQLKYDVNSRTVNYADFENGYAKYGYREKYGLIDSAGTRVYPAIFEDVGAFSTPFIAVKKRGKWGYADADVNLKIKYQYDYAWPFIDSTAIVELAGKQGIIDVAGEYVFGATADEITRFPEHQLFKVQLEGKVGLINHKGDTLIPISQTNIVSLNHGLWMIEQPSGMAIYHLKKQQFVYKEPSFTWVIEAEIKEEGGEE